MRQHPIGTGPFKFGEFKPNERIAVARNPDYWNPVGALAEASFLGGAHFHVHEWASIFSGTRGITDRAVYPHG
jgi:ABC-type transport system substrate-binding protein